MDRGLNDHVTPVLILDQALVALRRARAAQWLSGMAAGLPLAVVVLALYWMEEVAGLCAPLPLFALLCSLAYGLRFCMLSTLACELTELCAPSSPPSAHPKSGSGDESDESRIARVPPFQTAMLAGAESCAWTGLLLVCAQQSLALALACAPLLSARGALAPSLLARAGCAPEVGWAAVSRALADTRGARRLFASVELLSLVGLLVLFVNLYALAMLSLLVASSALGLDVGFVSALMAPDNWLVLLLLLGVSMLATEPLRAAISAVALRSARERCEGADLYAAIEALPAPPPLRAEKSIPPRMLGAWVLLGTLAAATSAQASEREPALSGSVAEVGMRARAHAEAILARGEFRKSFGGEAAGLSFLDRLLSRQESSDHDFSAAPRFEVRLPPALLVGCSLLLLLAVGVWLTRGPSARPRSRVAPQWAPVGARVASEKQLELRSIPEQLEAASRLAATGAYAAALQTLHAASMQLLSRVQPGILDRARTNGQVLQSLAPGPLRSALSLLTERFERSRYGRQTVGRRDFERARALVSQIVQHAAEPSAVVSAAPAPAVDSGRRGPPA